MALKYIVKQAGLKMGLDPSDQSQRDILLRFANEAIVELYEQADAEGCLREQLFQVNGDETISLPLYVGPIRAMREYSTHVPWHLYDMRPRYNQLNWEDRWRGWRVKGMSALSSVIENESQIYVAVKTLETTPVTYTVSGSTKDAQFVTDTITLDSASLSGILDPVGKQPVFYKQGTLNFTDIVSFKKDRVNNFNAALLDADGNLLSVLANNMLEAKYRVVDVSLYPWSNTAVGPVDHYMEVLYKQALPWFQNDDDEYPAPGFDNIIVNKMLQIWAEESGKADVAVAYDAKATRSFSRKDEDQRRGCEEKVALVENPHDTLLPRNRPMGPSRYMGQIYY